MYMCGFYFRMGFMWGYTVYLIQRCYTTSISRRRHTNKPIQIHFRYALVCAYWHIVQIYGIATCNCSGYTHACIRYQAQYSDTPAGGHQIQYTDAFTNSASNTCSLTLQSSNRVCIHRHIRCEIYSTRSLTHHVANAVYVFTDTSGIKCLLCCHYHVRYQIQYVFIEQSDIKHILHVHWHIRYQI